MSRTAVVIPNWNGLDTIQECLDSVLKQTREIIVVDNGSTDGSLEFIRSSYPAVELVKNKVNLGFAGGVNTGINKARELGYDYVILLNNDAVVENNWLKLLVSELDKQSDVGIATSKILTSDGKRIDSTGDVYTSWGLPYPRGRNEPTSNKYDQSRDIFSASGGASIYRVAMLDEIGLFDNNFFAYYEDVDISFRAQLYGWKVRYVPGAIVHHQIGSSSRRIKGFTTYQTMKNLPLVLIKNVPGKYILSVGIRLLFAQSLFLAKAVTKGNGWPAIKGAAKAVILTPASLKQRSLNMANQKVSDDYIWGLVVHDLPPNAKALRLIRKVFSIR